MAPRDPHQHDRPAQRAQDRAFPEKSDVASQALNEALRVSFRLLKVAMCLVIILFLGSGVFIVKEGQKAFVLRFGRLVGEKDEAAVLGAGLHFAWPFLIDEVVRFPVGRELSLEVRDFWYPEQTRAGQGPPATLEPGRGGYALTGDANILHSIWSIGYNVHDPIKLYRHLADPVEIARLDPHEPQGTIPDLLRSLLHSAVIRALATTRVDDVIGGGGRAALKETVKTILDRKLREVDVGITATKLTLDKLAVPLQTQAVFNEVSAAVQEKDTLVKQAEADAERIITEADGEASRIKDEAREYAISVVKQAEADSNYIDALIAEASKSDNPAMLSLFLKQRLIEVLQEVLAEAYEIYIVERNPAGHTTIRLIGGRDPKAVKDYIRRQRREREKAKAEARGAPPAETAP